MPDAPSTQDFATWIDLMPGKPSQIIVKGEVETNGGHLVPVLDKAVPQGFNPQILLLTLSIRDTGMVGTADVTFRPVRYSAPASAGQFSDVTVLWDGQAILNLAVSETH